MMVVMVAAAPAPAAVMMMSVMMMPVTARFFRVPRLLLTLFCGRSLQRALQLGPLICGETFENLPHVRHVIASCVRRSTRGASRPL
jgi:hypothetical protein